MKFLLAILLHRYVGWYEYVIHKNTILISLMYMFTEILNCKVVHYIHLHHDVRPSS